MGIRGAVRVIPCLRFTTLLIHRKKYIKKESFLSLRSLLPLPPLDQAPPTYRARRTNKCSIEQLFPPHKGKSVTLGRILP